MAGGGAELKRRRTAKNWSRQELAVKVGVHQAAVAQWETDQYTPRLPNAEALDDVLEAGGAVLHAFGYASEQPITLESIDAKLDEILRLLRPPGPVSSAGDTREALEQHVAQSREQARAEVGPTLRRLDAHDGERAARPRRQPRQQDHKV